MKILVCIKQIPDIENLRIDPETKTLIRDTKEQIINPLDLNAIEEALWIKDKKNGSVTTITMGSEPANKALIEAIAMGSDKAYLISDRYFKGSDTYATALTLSKAVEFIAKHDLIICGAKAIDGETGQTGPELAEFLKITQISNVTGILKLNKKYITALTLTDIGYSIIRSKLPALITVVKSINIPRAANLKNYHKAFNIKIPILNSKILSIDPAESGLAGSPTKVIKIKNVVYDKKIKFLNGTADEIAEKLLKIISECKSRQILKKEHTNLNKLNSGSKRKIFLLGEADEKIHYLIEKGKILSRKCNAELSCIFLGKKIAAKLPQNLDVHKIYIIEDKNLKNFDPDLYAEYLKAFILKEKPEILIANATLSGKALMPRLAAKLHTGLTADCTTLDIDKNNNLLQIRPAIGGNILASIICPNKKPQMATISPMIIKPEKISNYAQIIRLDKNLLKIQSSDNNSSIKTLLNLKRSNKFNIENSDIIISGGKGVGNKNNFKILNELAKLLGGKTGASRAAVESGWADYSSQVGQTGKKVSPKIYIACGISGAIQHLSGMQNSDTIIAINKDENAPIFKAADFGIVADYKMIINETVRLLKKSGVKIK